MFLCGPCLATHYTNGPSRSQSVGPCENCRRVRLCSDIPSFALNTRYEPKVRAKKKATRRPTAWDKILKGDD